MDNSISNPQKIYVVFSGETDIRWLKILKPGFRHCFAIINDGERWISVDPLSARLETMIYHHLEADFDLPEWLENRGYRVMAAPIKTSHKRAAPAMVFSCVEVIKRLLGIHDRLMITPHQLYQFLEKQNRAQNKMASANHSQPNILKGETQWVA